MKYTLIVMILTISFTSIARGVDQTNPTDRSIKIDWVKHPGAKKVLAGVETLFGHCTDNMKIIPTGDFSDTNGDKWRETGVNSGDEDIWSINSVFSYINVDEGKFGNNTVTCNLTVKDGTKFTATYDFETVEKTTVTVKKTYYDEINRSLAYADGPFADDQKYMIERKITNTMTWSKNVNDSFVTEFGAGFKIGNTNTNTVTAAGDETVRSVISNASINLSAGVTSKVETVINHKLEDSITVSMNSPLDISLPKNNKLLMESYIAAQKHDVTIATYADSDNDGFPESETPEQTDITTVKGVNIGLTYKFISVPTTVPVPTVPVP